MKHDFRKTKALVIDDFSQMRKAFRNMLETFGVANIDEAANGKTAIALIQRSHYDIILCDYNLGEEQKTGQQVLEEAKHRNFIGYSTIFIMITAEASIPWVMGAMEHLPDDYLVKPITKDVLKLRLQKLMDKKEILKPIQRAVEQKNFDLAIEACDAALAENPKKRFEILRIRGDIHLRIGNYKAAERTYELVLEQRSLPWALLGLGQVYYYQQNYQESIEQFRQIIAENDNYMPAYDWLSKALAASGDSETAQNTLIEAIKHSPIALHRQKELGALAYNNEDYDTAARSYRSAVRLGTHSCFKEATDYTGLAKSLANQGTNIEAMRVIESAKREFHRDEAALTETAMSESIIYNKMGKTDEAKEAAERANDHRQKTSNTAISNTSLEFARACFEFGNDDLAKDILKDVIKSNHEDKDIASNVNRIFENAGHGDYGREMISEVRTQMVNLNNKGVRMVEEDNLKDAMELFIKAAEGLPLNLTINLNAAQVLVQYMQRFGVQNDSIDKARIYLDRVEAREPQNKKLITITRSLSKLSAD